MAGTFPSRFADSFEAGHKPSWVVFQVASKTTSTFAFKAKTSGRLEGVSYSIGLKRLQGGQPRRFQDAWVHPWCLDRETWERIEFDCLQARMTSYQLTDSSSYHSFASLQESFLKVASPENVELHETELEAFLESLINHVTSQSRIKSLRPQESQKLIHLKHLYTTGDAFKAPRRFRLEGDLESARQTLSTRIKVASKLTWERSTGGSRFGGDLKNHPRRLVTGFKAVCKPTWKRSRHDGRLQVEKSPPEGLERQMQDLGSQVGLKTGAGFQVDLKTTAGFQADLRTSSSFQADLRTSCLQVVFRTKNGFKDDLKTMMVLEASQKPKGAPVVYDMLSFITRYRRSFISDKFLERNKQPIRVFEEAVGLMSNIMHLIIIRKNAYYEELKAGGTLPSEIQKVSQESAGLMGPTHRNILPSFN
ncbi:hypothetical protein PGT21_012680 [Puccinia graminis f. sp. tritici]|uniref:Uncharacterized protein n=1 Tax=Puccinia graminis f. sp. tritici TaxID=56615 RepID=A0A5B0MA40_PUCGR|nr:hypothetical protein PGT21_012680 [Puccinia graminis f. sp. tritici]